MCKKTCMSPAKNSKSEGQRTGIIRAISTPLGFYVLSLLIVEATIGLVLTASKLSEDHVWYGFFVAIALFSDCIHHGNRVGDLVPEKFAVWQRGAFQTRTGKISVA
jgi:hypothetical protein